MTDNQLVILATGILGLTSGIVLLIASDSWDRAVLWFGDHIDGLGVAFWGLFTLAAIGCMFWR